MALDGLMIHHLVNEINILVNGKIGKISQVGNNDFLFVIRAQGKNNKLFISLERNQYRIALTENEYISPANATMFTMLLRKHFEGGTILEITQYDLDRIVIFKISKTNEFGDKVSLDIVGFFEDEYKEIIDNLSEKKIINFHGFQTDTVPYYQNCRCVILPS